MTFFCCHQLHVYVVTLGHFAGGQRSGQCESGSQNIERLGCQELQRSLGSGRVFFGRGVQHAVHLNSPMCLPSDKIVLRSPHLGDGLSGLKQRMQMLTRLFGLGIVGDIGEGANQPARGERLGFNLQHPPTGRGAGVVGWQFGDMAADIGAASGQVAVQIGRGALQVLPKVTALELVLHHFMQRRVALHGAGGQVQQLARPLVEGADTSVCTHYHHALADAGQHALDQVILLHQLPAQIRRSKFRGVCDAACGRATGGKIKLHERERRRAAFKALKVVSKLPSRNLPQFADISGQSPRQVTPQSCHDAKFIGSARSGQVLR